MIVLAVLAPFITALVFAALLRAASLLEQRVLEPVDLEMAAAPQG